MENRIVIIKNKGKTEEIKITWEDSLRYIEGHASFDELKEKYKGSISDVK